MALNDSVPSDVNASDTSSSRMDGKTALRRLLIVIHPRELLCGFLSYWLRALNQDFEVMSAPEVKKLVSSDMLSRACAVIIGANGFACPDSWLDNQIAFLRATRRSVPIVVICEDDTAEKYAGMSLQGYIPTSTTVEVAAAAINLVTAGGSYIPFAWDKLLHSKGLLSTPPATEPQSASSTLLTPREKAVLDLLQRGMPNKIIAHNLRISHSTVKAHVHNIIAKLDVHNRTEAAVTGHRMQPPKPNMDRATPQPSNGAQKINEIVSPGADLARRINGHGYVLPLPTPSSKKISR